jgi:hypothetical protein
MSTPSFTLESWFEVQLAEAEANALEADLQDKVIVLLANQYELNEYIADYIALHGEAGRLELQAQLEPHREAMDRLTAVLTRLMEKYQEPQGDDDHGQVPAIE